ncbi:hypothetical protein CBS101457_006622 [Exobasidium rhododendri]|nr:hypothetical protein CBS101457_006622 [Exobasidium rhododendri]
MTDRAVLAAPLLLQAPPGQLPNVYEDLLGLVGSEGDDAQQDESRFVSLAATVREQHNIEQNIVVELPNEKGRSVLCFSAAHAGQSNRFLAPRQKITFAVDHETLKTSDEKSYKPNATVEGFRSLLETYLSEYVEDRYATGLVDVFAVSLPRIQVPVHEETVESAIDATEAEGKETATEPVRSDAEDQMEGQEEEGERHNVINEEAMQQEDEEKANSMEDVVDDPVTTAEAMEEVEESNKISPVNAAVVEEEDTETEGETKVVIHIVANRYKLSNFWSGRWRATYTISSPSANEMEGDVKVQIHYFEEGNVQLNSNKAERLALPNESVDEDSKAKAIVRVIEKFEADYQEVLFKTCNELSEGAFKALRRQLPMTKQKVDWDKVLNYKLGSELTDAS